MTVKQVIVIRRDLGMRRGKEIAQGSHASQAWLLERLRYGRCPPRNFADSEVHCLTLSDPEREWLAGEFRKVVCQVQTETELHQLFDQAQAAGVERHLVTDLGATEFNGVPTVTALAIGPADADLIDPITRHLKLY